MQRKDALRNLEVSGSVKSVGFSKGGTFPHLSKIGRSTIKILHTDFTAPVSNWGGGCRMPDFENAASGFKVKMTCKCSDKTCQSDSGLELKFQDLGTLNLMLETSWLGNTSESDGSACRKTNTFVRSFRHTCSFLASFLALLLFAW